MTVPFGYKIFRKDCRISEMRSYGLFAMVTMFSRFFPVPVEIELLNLRFQLVKYILQKQHKIENRKYSKKIQINI